MAVAITRMHDMSTLRRYTESEIAAILKQAAQDQEDAHAGAPYEGLTLVEIQEAGRAAGIAPAFVARAAAMMDAVALIPPPRMYLGQRVSMAQTVDLPGPFTDSDWDTLVMDLRHTFDARGTVSEAGPGRQWSNGNLRVYVEPTSDGHRLHFRTRNAALQGRLGGGLLLALMSLFVTAVFLLDGDAGSATAFGMGGLLGLFAAGLYGSGAYLLPRWRSERARQMRDITLRALDRAQQHEADAASAEAATATTLQQDEHADSEHNGQDGQRPRSGQRTT